jgi:hypothetical protein
MTERKICKEVDGKWEDGEWIPDNLVPLDPQPCCRTCKNANYGRDVEWCAEIGGRIPDLDFYCLYWELKE